MNSRPESRPPSKDPANDEPSPARRRLLAGIFGLTLGSLSGCALLQDEVQRSASPAGLDEQTQTQTSFEHQGTDELTLNQTVQVAGESRDLSLTNHLAKYQRAAPGSEGAVASVQLFSTPSVSVGDREANPFWDADPKQFLKNVATGEQIGGFDEVREVGTREFSVLGQSRTFQILETTTERQGKEVIVRLPTGKFKHDGDILGLFGGYPAALGGQQQVQTALQGVVHPI